MGTSMVMESTQRDIYGARGLVTSTFVQKFCYPQKNNKYFSLDRNDPIYYSYKSVKQFWKIKKIDRVFFFPDPIWPQEYKLYYIVTKASATAPGMCLCDLYLLELNSRTRF